MQSRRRCFWKPTPPLADVKNSLYYGTLPSGLAPRSRSRRVLLETADTTTSPKIAPYPKDDRPKNVARNVGIKRPNEPSEAAVLVLLECLGWCPFQHDCLRLAGSIVNNRMKLEGAIWFRTNF